MAARTTAFTSAHPGEDVVRLTLDEAVDLLLVGAPPELVATGLPTADLETILERAPCDVGVLVRRRDRARGATGADRPILVPFGGAEHDWAAIELAAWVASAQNVPLRLLGTDADPRTGTRDASRLLARASLVVQRATDVAAEPLLVPPGADGILRAAEGGGAARGRLVDEEADGRVSGTCGSSLASTGSSCRCCSFARACGREGSHRPSR